MPGKATKSQYLVLPGNFLSTWVYRRNASWRKRAAVGMCAFAVAFFIWCPCYVCCVCRPADFVREMQFNREKKKRETCGSGPSCLNRSNLCVCVYWTCYVLHSRTARLSPSFISLSLKEHKKKFSLYPFPRVTPAPSKRRASIPARPLKVTTD